MQHCVIIFIKIIQFFKIWSIIQTVLSVFLSISFLIFLTTANPLLIYVQSALITDLHIHLWALYVLHWAIVNSWGYSFAENSLPDTPKIVLSLDISAHTASVTCVSTDACCILGFEGNRVRLLLLAWLQQAVSWAMNWNITKIMARWFTRCFLQLLLHCCFSSGSYCSRLQVLLVLREAHGGLFHSLALKSAWLFVWILLKIWGRMCTRFKESYTVWLFEKRLAQSVVSAWHGSRWRSDGVIIAQSLLLKVDKVDFWMNKTLLISVEALLATSVHSP